MMPALTADGDGDAQIYVLQINSASPGQGATLIEAELHEENLLCLRLALTCGKCSQQPIFITGQVNREQLKKHQSCDKNGIFIFLKNL